MSNTDEVKAEEQFENLKNRYLNKFEAQDFSAPDLTRCMIQAREIGFQEGESHRPAPVSIDVEKVIEKIETLRIYGGHTLAHEAVNETIDKAISILRTHAQTGELPPGNDKAWNTHDVLTKLIEAAEILLHKKNYDGHGHEEISLCCERGKEILKEMFGSNATPRQGEVKPVQIGDSHGMIHYCSSCDFPKNETLTMDMKHCFNCGVKLDWSEWNLPSPPSTEVKKVIPYHCESEYGKEIDPCENHFNRE